MTFDYLQYNPTFPDTDYMDLRFILISFLKLKILILLKIQTSLYITEFYYVEPEFKCLMYCNVYQYREIFILKPTNLT